MKIILSDHVINEKIPLIETWGFHITHQKIRQTVRKPIWRGKTRLNQPTAMSLLDDNHILRVIFEKKNGIIVVITIHPARRGTYESTKD